MKRSPQSGFTLVELLAVVAMIAVVIAFAVPATTQIMKGSSLAQGSQLVNDTLLLGRQYAISRSRPIEVRFYRYGDPNTPGEKFDDPSSGKWRAIQLFDVFENGAVLPASEMTRLPQGVIIHPEEYSTLVREQLRPHIDASGDLTAPEIPLDVDNRKVGRNYWISAFRFLPDGSTDLPPTASTNGSDDPSTSDADRWYITMVGLADENKSVSQMNFFTIQIDSLTGALKSFRR
jgi:uncharacterized protein (TIGR02596 family)